MTSEELQAKFSEMENALALLGNLFLNLFKLCVLLLVLLVLGFWFWFLVT